MPISSLSTVQCTDTVTTDTVTDTVTAETATSTDTANGGGRMSTASSMSSEVIVISSDDDEADLICKTPYKVAPAQSARKCRKRKFDEMEPGRCPSDQV